MVDALDGQGLDLVAEGSIYPLLARMEKAGLLSSFKAPSPEGPPRKYYELTEAGTQELIAGAAEWHSVSGQVGRLLDRATKEEPSGATH